MSFGSRVTRKGVLDPVVTVVAEDYDELEGIHIGKVLVPACVNLRPFRFPACCFAFWPPIAIRLLELWFCSWGVILRCELECTDKGLFGFVW